MRRAYLLIPLGFLFMSLGLVGCSPAPKMWTGAKEGQKKILVSFPPLYAITQAVAGSDAYVLCLLTTQGPHDYQGDQKDLFMVNEADLFIYHGMTLDDQFVSKMLRNHKNRTLTSFAVGNALEKKRHDLMLHGHHDEGPEHKGHKHGDHDPHLWLGIPQTVEMTKLIAAQLAELDPANKKGYEKRAAEFVVQLDKLHADGKAKFKDKKNKKFISMHEAFEYFADADHGFDLTIAGVIQKKPGLDPDAASMAKLIETCKKGDVRVIAVEPQYSQAQAETLQRTLKKAGIDARIITLDTLETAEAGKDQKFNPDPEYYLKRMKENIDTLAKALP